LHERPKRSAGSSCAFYVTFTKPASGSQTVIGSVTITDNAVTIANPNKVSTQIVYLFRKMIGMERPKR